MRITTFIRRAGAVAALLAAVARAAYLGTLALRYVPSRAPAGYWNPSRCSDGGSRDLDRKRASLR